MNDVTYLANLTLSRFKMFKRMVNAIVRLGVERETAINMVISLMRTN